MVCCPSSYAENIIFDVVLDKAIVSSVELMIAAEDELIADAARLETTAKFFPQIFAKFNTDYTYDYGINPSSTIINGKFYNDSTVWDSSASVGFQYDIFNFFTDVNAYRYASKSVKMSRYQSVAMRRNLAVTMVDIFEQVLVNYYNARFYDEMAKCALELYDVRKRLYEAGVGNKQQYFLAGAQLADYQIQKLNSEKSLIDALEQISYYTGEKYYLTDVPMEFQVNADYYNTPDFTEYPEYIIAEMKIQQKQLEKYIVGGEFLPRFFVYGNYYFYGKDRSAYDRAVKDMQTGYYKIGIGVSWNIFDGTATYRKYARISAERRKFELEKLQTIKKINLENNRLITANEYLKKSNAESEFSAELTSGVFAFNEALRGVNLTGAADILTQQINTLEKLQEQKVISIRFASEVKRLEVINRFIK